MSPRNALTTVFASADTLSHGRDTGSVTDGTPTQMRLGHTECGSGHQCCAGADTSSTVEAAVRDAIGGAP
ncbi:hypothetical protein [Mycobacteroides abscessus]|uniref:hypothetical protein n=1 Tax=Mycobacteroides abscessus TaxID=36809 RepID=UPI00092C5042|nr:hypothetical protein [Mycobacteroides abscessus]SIJ93655.1 Uncharacterised protein [Mycobacteroides abscessus subsp. abscessus]